MRTAITETPSANPDEALIHFEAMLRFETDCWDVHESLAATHADFTLVDVRSPSLFAAGHIAGALNIPHAKMIASRMKNYPATTFVVYCAGPHCNGANKAAIRLARIGLPVKMMIGGITGWLDEGFELTEPDMNV